MITKWILSNLFVVILVDNFTKCFVISKMDIQKVPVPATVYRVSTCICAGKQVDGHSIHVRTSVIWLQEHIEQFKKVWSEGSTDPGMWSHLYRLLLDRQLNNEPIIHFFSISTLSADSFFSSLAMRLLTLTFCRSVCRRSVRQTAFQLATRVQDN